MNYAYFKNVIQMAYRNVSIFLKYYSMTHRNNTGKIPER